MKNNKLNNIWDWVENNSRTIVITATESFVGFCLLLFFVSPATKGLENFIALLGIICWVLLLARVNVLESRNQTLEEEYEFVKSCYQRLFSQMNTIIANQDKLEDFIGELKNDKKS